MAYETPLTIIDVINGISMNKYVLPAIQREFVWSTSQIETLFDSIMQSYPIGAFLFWELNGGQNTLYDFYAFLQNYHEKNERHNKRVNLTGNENVMSVLDGQQRLTSLYVGLMGSYAYRTKHKHKNSDNAFPKRKLYLNLVAAAENENDRYEFKFLSEDECKNDNTHYWFGVNRIVNMSELGDVMKYWLSIKEPYTDEQKMFANDVLTQLFKVIHITPSIVYYKEKSNELDKVLNIFIRVNSGGTILSYSDLLLSIATAQWKTLDAREEITELVDDLNTIGLGFNVNKDFVLKASLALTDIKSVVFKVDNFNKPNMLKIEDNWQIIKRALMRAFTLISSFGFSGDNLKSNNAVIPIAYYLMMKGMPLNFEIMSAEKCNREKIKKWLIMSLLKRTFTNQPDSVLHTIRDIIRKNGAKDFPLDEIIQTMRGTTKSIIFTADDIDALLEHQYNNKETLTILMLLYPSLDFNNKFHIDHMYPKSKFNKKNLLERGIDEKECDAYIAKVNELSNLQLLPAIPNMEKQDKDFLDWFNDNYPNESDKIQYRLIHYLPKMDYTYKNFELFIEKRKGLLRQKLEQLLL